MEIIYDGKISTKRYIEKYQPNNISKKIAKYRRYFSLVKMQFGWSTWALGAVNAWELQSKLKNELYFLQLKGFEPPTKHSPFK